MISRKQSKKLFWNTKNKKKIIIKKVKQKNTLKCRQIQIAKTFVFQNKQRNIKFNLWLGYGNTENFMFKWKI